MKVYNTIRWTAPEHYRAAIGMDRERNGDLILDPRPECMKPPRRLFHIDPFGGMHEFPLGWKPSDGEIFKKLDEDLARQNSIRVS